MVLKHGPVLAVCLACLAGGVSHAAGYRPGQFFNLDVAHAVLSPNPLGPPAHFEQIPIEASTASDDKAVPDAKVTQAQAVPAGKPHRIARIRRGVAKRRAVHPRFARRSHNNPMDAQAFDTRIQVWPCRSGGICNWHGARHR